jgi:Na+:H+ antiporter, NhaA family
VRLIDLAPAALLDPIQLGIALGLFIGQQIGIDGAIVIAIRCGLGALPEGAD